MSGEPGLAAGDFSAWLVQMDQALAGQADAEVPCDGCTACCRASQFVHVGPDDTDARAHIPAELLFPAPGAPPGHHLMGYDERGHCPMLVDDRCSIYEHRPRTCRTYDCRIFPATGLDVASDGDPGKDDIAARAGRWRFGHPNPDDRERHEAVQAAAAYLVDHPEAVPDGMAPSNTTQLAVLAVEARRAFVRRDASSGPRPEAVRVELRRRDASRDR